MKVAAMWVRVMLAGLSLFAAQQVFAAAKTLIELDGDTPKPGLATSWSKVKAGEYSFQLDPAGDLGKGAMVTPDAVKSSLESKLGASFGVKVSAKGAAAVSVVFTGDEKAFLAQVAKTKIRAGQDVALALESSTSEGSIRAKKTERPAGAGEVKALVIKSEGGVILAKAMDSKTPQVKSGDKVKIKGDIKGIKKNDSIFFKPGTKEGEVIVPAPGSLLQ